MNYDIDRIKTNAKTDAWQDMRRFLVEQAMELRDLSKMPITLNPFKQTIEVRARRLAYERLTSMLEKVELWSRADERTIEDEQKDSFLV